MASALLQGRPQCELKAIGEANRTGTKVHFMPDDAIFEERDFSFDILSARLREIAFWCQVYVLN